MEKENGVVVAVLNQTATKGTMLMIESVDLVSLCGRVVIFTRVNTRKMNVTVTERCTGQTVAVTRVNG
jgi:hypothetical protein